MEVHDSKQTDRRTDTQRIKEKRRSELNEKLRRWLKEVGRITSRSWESTRSTRTYRTKTSLFIVALAVLVNLLNRRYKNVFVRCWALEPLSSPFLSHARSDSIAFLCPSHWYPTSYWCHRSHCCIRSMTAIRAMAGMRGTHKRDRTPQIFVGQIICRKSTTTCIRGVVFVIV